MTDLQSMVDAVLALHKPREVVLDQDDAIFSSSWVDNRDGLAKVKDEPWEYRLALICDYCTDYHYCDDNYGEPGTVLYPCPTAQACGIPEAPAYQWPESPNPPKPSPALGSGEWLDRYMAEVYRRDSGTLLDLLPSAPVDQGTSSWDYVYERQANGTAPVGEFRILSDFVSRTDEFAAINYAKMRGSMPLTPSYVKVSRESMERAMDPELQRTADELMESLHNGLTLHTPTAPDDEKHCRCCGDELCECHGYCERCDYSMCDEDCDR